RAPEGDTAAVTGRDLVTERQTEPGAACRGPAAAEAFEHDRQLELVDAGASVAHLDGGGAAVGAHRELDRGRRRRMTEGVVHEVEDETLQKVGRPPHRHRTLRPAREVAALLL